MLTYYKSGTTVTLTVQSLTDGAYVEHEVEITLGSRPATKPISNGRQERTAEIWLIG